VRTSKVWIHWSTSKYKTHWRYCHLMVECLASIGTHSHSHSVVVLGHSARYLAAVGYAVENRALRLSNGALLEGVWRFQNADSNSCCKHKENTHRIIVTIVSRGVSTEVKQYQPTVDAGVILCLHTYTFDPNTRDNNHSARSQVKFLYRCTLFFSCPLAFFMRWNQVSRPRKY